MAAAAVVEQVETDVKLEVAVTITSEDTPTTEETPVATEESGDVPVVSGDTGDSSTQEKEEPPAGESLSHSLSLFIIVHCLLYRCRKRRVNIYPEKFYCEIPYTLSLGL